MIIILAGGKSTRMGKEKPVLKIAGKEMLLWVYASASRVDETIVALSKNTPKTRELCLREGIPFMETPGKGYVEDVQWLLNEFGPFISSSSDIPFVKPSDFYAVKKAFNGKTSLTGVLPIQKVPKDLKPLVYRGYAIVGLNAVGFEGEGFFELENPLLALNVNTPEDLKLAERIARLVRKVIFGWEDLTTGR
ncbi:GTP:adenosylcobinamide-phosphate guanylyltransferase [Thermococcus kodakarensis KOD1]|uniref:GTP:adenosylcobinamide-phosphate guanylyltransferase n=1 Tax=Thermococcus kodakarensis (strain ATCC BAA-918 / JCM 12380 / KOD1) TaxID=69014 RepID=Q5JHZ8_THEKO|nr:GTP--adenosylcobinamide-phosphate guanylyltransferase [Thermococcus kodakarensis]WCN28859.1 GTP--adenosylcobinamide-phosphate guanylyltransferase [Thermococcus kodakarensis]WCN31161.1 GTP--adenosylcobinamide-phosphate guanylyltransferase [Thermococcus kodakarensis]BAD85045.1 GTP:adenosylcobinamide-phosphate guanylyltransferase [Thermococcus kodakarensis KOD1]